ncbi:MULTISPECIES: 50S ribosomal protein L4 [unclassified Frankia]|uniref:50S ribosomal protein L4 n=1 Tax=unclassified Frankia TaxID=2632575 RepID=UPI001EF3F7B1|nr:MULTISPECIES: 50S ribosomal protein L4 [unclassified Frankia]
MSAATTSARARSRTSAAAAAVPETRTIVVHAPTGGEVGSAQLPGAVFDVALNVPLIHQVVVAQLAAARQGTHSTLTRGEVRGGGRKPYRQKGTGRARQGSLRAPQFTGGGIVHGPKPRSYDQRTPKKMKAAALRGALSDRARNNRIHVVSSLVAGATPSTKAALTALRTIADTRRVLVVAARDDELTWKSLRNVPAVHLLDPGQLNTYDVLVSDDVVFTEGALAAFLARSQVLAAQDGSFVPAGDAEPLGTQESRARSDDGAEAEEEAK